MSHYEVYGTYDLYVTSEMLNTVIGFTELSRVEKLFASAISHSNINVNFEFVESALTSSDGNVHFRATFAPKADQ